MELLINAVLVLVGVGVVFLVGAMVYISAGIILMDCQERRAKKEAKRKLDNYIAKLTETGK